MTFDWSGFLALAEGLRTYPDRLGPEEASLRSAASRAYYAAYNRALDYALAEDFRPNYRSLHKELQEYYGRKGRSSPAHAEIERKLNRLQRQREIADYEDALDRLPLKLAKQATMTADSILNRLEDLRVR